MCILNDPTGHSSATSAQGHHIWYCIVTLGNNNNTSRMWYTVHCTGAGDSDSDTECLPVLL